MFKSIAVPTVGCKHEHRQWSCGGTRGPWPHRDCSTCLPLCVSTGPLQAVDAGAAEPGGGQGGQVPPQFYAYCGISASDIAQT